MGPLTATSVSWQMSGIRHIREGLSLTYLQLLRVISMSDQPTSNEKPSNTALYILGGMATLIVLMWFLTHLWW